MSELTLRHELAVMDVKVALTKALRAWPGIHLQQYSTWPRLSQFKSRMPSGYGSQVVTVKPDRFLRFYHDANNAIDEHMTFQEIDCGTASNRVLTERILAYREHYQSGNFALSRGGTREEREQFPFRVLVIVKTPDRMANLAERLLNQNPPVTRMVWMATMSDVLQTPLSNIWQVPAHFGKSDARPSSQDRARRAAALPLI